MSSDENDLTQSATNNEGNASSTFNPIESSSDAIVPFRPLVHQHTQNQYLLDCLSTQNYQSLMAERNWFSCNYLLLQQNNMMRNMFQGTMHVPRPQLPPSNEERVENEIIRPIPRRGKAPMTDELLEEMATRALQSSGKNHGFSDMNPNVRLPPSSEDATATNYQGIMAEAIERRRRGIFSHSATKRKRVIDLTIPGTEVLSSHLPARLGVEKIMTGTMPELEAALVESAKVFKPSGDGLETLGGSSNDKDLKELASMPMTGSSMGATCVPNSEGGPSNPTPGQAVVDVPTGVDLLSDFSMAVKLFESFLGVEQKARLDERDLESSFTQLITSILQSHLFAVAYRKKASSQMEKLMANSGDVEHLKSVAGMLQAEISELRAKNGALQDDNEILQVTRNTLSHRLHEIRLEQGRREVEWSLLAKANKELQEKVAQLEADLALVRDKDEKERARLEAKVKALRMKRNTDKYSAELDRNWMVLKTKVDTLHEIQNKKLDDLPLAIEEAEAAAKSARGFLEQALAGNGEDGSESDDSMGLSNNENKDAPAPPPS